MKSGKSMKTVFCYSVIISLMFLLVSDFSRPLQAKPNVRKKTIANCYYVCNPEPEISTKNLMYVDKNDRWTMNFSSSKFWGKKWYEHNGSQWAPVHKKELSGNIAGASPSYYWIYFPRIEYPIKDDSVTISEVQCDPELAGYTMWVRLDSGNIMGTYEGEIFAYYMGDNESETEYKKITGFKGKERWFSFSVPEKYEKTKWTGDLYVFVYFSGNSGLDTKYKFCISPVQMYEHPDNITHFDSPNDQNAMS